MPKPGPMLKWTALGLGGILAAAVVAGAVAYGWLDSASGRDWLKRQIETAVSTPGETELSIGALEGSPWRTLTARAVTLRDPAGAWLQLDAAELTWRPVALLRGRLEIEALTVGTIAVDRPPAAPGAASETGDSSAGLAALFDLPVSIRVERLAAKEIVLGEGLLGQAARFTLSGQTASDETQKLTADLTAVRLDGPEAELRLAVAFDPTRDHLAVEAEASDAAGGLIAALVEMRDLPKLDLSLSGQGPLNAWDGSFTFSLGSLASAEAAIGIRRTAEHRLALTLDGRSDISAPEPSSPWALLAGTTQVSMQAAWTAEDHVEVETLSLAGGSLNASLSGTAEVGSGVVDLTVRANAEDSQALSGLLDLDGLRQVSADLRVQGPIMQPAVVFEVTGQGVAAAGFRAAAVGVEGRANAESDLFGPAPALNLDVQGLIAGAQLNGEDAINAVIGETARWSLTGRLDADTGRMGIAKLEASSGSATLGASGTADAQSGSAELDVIVGVAELETLQPLTDVTLRGRAALQGPLRLEGFGELVETTLAGRWEQASSDIGILTTAAKGGVDLEARLTYTDDGLRVEALTASAAARLEGGVAVTPAGDLADGRYRLTLPDAAVLAGDLGAAFAGPVALEGTFGGPVDALETAGTAAVSEVRVTSEALSDLRATYALKLRGPDIEGPVTLALASPFGALDGSADLRLQENRLRLDKLQARLPEASVDGTAVVPLDGADPAADLTAELADLAPWLRLAGLDGSGRGTLALQLNGANGEAPLLATADLSSLALTVGPDTPPLRADSVLLRLQGEGLSVETEGALKIEAEGVIWNELQMARLTAEGTGTAENLDISLSTTGTWIEPLDLRLDGNLARRGDSLALELAKAEGNLLGQPLALAKPARLSIGGGEIALQDLDLAAGEARLSGQALLSDTQLQASAALDSLPLEMIDALWASGLEGRVSARLALSGPRTAPEGSGDVTLDGLRPRGGKDLPALNLTATSVLRNGRVQVDGQLGGADVAAARFRADAPLRVTETGGLEVPPDEPLTGEFGWSGDLATLLLFVPLPEHRLDGDAEVALTASGSPRAPRLDGQIALSRGRYENLETGTLLRDLEVLATVREDQVTLTRLTANDGSGGRVTGDGEMSIDPAAGFPFSVSVALDKVHALRRDDVTAVAGGTVEASGTLEAPRVVGRITTETVEISLLAALPPDVVSLDVTELKGDAPRNVPEDRKAAPPVDPALDIVIDMPRRVFVRGRGLDSEWGGRIAVAGNASAPEVTGEINVVRGQLSVVGKPFDLRNGKVTLPKSANSETELDVTADYQGKDLNVTARMAGPLSRPSLELASTPALPRDEILSRVLFNKASSGLSGAEAAQLALAVQELRGEGASGILDFARRTLGVDVLRVDTSDGGAPAVEAGRYLTDDVYVGVKQGTSAQQSAAGVEVELTPNITVESEVTGSGANKSGVRFQWDY